MIRPTLFRILPTLFLFLAVGDLTACGDPCESGESYCADGLAARCVSVDTSTGERHSWEYTECDAGACVMAHGLATCAAKPDKDPRCSKDGWLCLDGTRALECSDAFLISEMLCSSCSEGYCAGGFYSGKCDDDCADGLVCEVPPDAVGAFPDRRCRVECSCPPDVECAECDNAIFTTHRWTCKAGRCE